MCELCNGTRVVHEITSFGYRTSCCDNCGPVSNEEWRAEMEQLLRKLDKESGSIE